SSHTGGGVRIASGLARVYFRHLAVGLHSDDFGTTVPLARVTYRLSPCDQADPTGEDHSHELAPPAVIMAPAQTGSRRGLGARSDAAESTASGFLAQYRPPGRRVHRSFRDRCRGADPCGR